MAAAVAMVAAAVPSPALAADDPLARAELTGQPSRGLIVKLRSLNLRGAQAESIVQATQSLGLSVQSARSLGSNQQLLLFTDYVDVGTATVAARLLQRRPDVAWAEPDRLAFATEEVVTPFEEYFFNQWDLWAQGRYPTAYSMNAPSAWRHSTGSPAVTVAVLDTGILPHPDLDGMVPGYDFISDPERARDGNGWDVDPRDEGDWLTDADLQKNGGNCWLSRSKDSSWHGLHVTGTIAATQGNGIGISGISPGVQLQTVRVLGRCGGWNSDIISGMRWAVGASVPGVPTNRTPARVLNMSLGAIGPCTPAYQDAIATARSQGAVVIVSAGNDDTDVANFFPASCAGAITVVAATTSGTRATYSNFGVTPGVADIAAPGGDWTRLEDGILSLGDAGKTTPGTRNYTYKVGTSMAAPHVAGAAALLYSAGVTNPDQVRQQLLSAVQPFGATGGTYACTVAACGSGIMDVARLRLEGASASAPAPPTDVTSSAGTYYVTVQWKPPLSDGGAGILRYRAVAEPGGESCSVARGLTCSVQGLLPNTQYRFTVTATNIAGTSLPSAASTPTMLERTPTAPDPPTALKAIPGDRSALVSWSAPADDGGSPITGYSVWTNGTKVCQTTQTSCTAANLTNGASYAFTVLAANAIGVSRASLPSAAVIPVAPATAPSAPTSISVTSDDARVVVTWKRPGDDGGSPITGYTATASPGSKSCATTSAETCTISGLANGTTYSIIVTATNAIGEGAASVPVTATPKALTTVPGSPLDVTAAPGDRKVVASWSAPLSTGGSAITGYTATANPSGKTCTVSAATSCTIDGLTNGTTYTVSVTAANSAGSSLPSASSGAVTPRPDPAVPAAPTGVTATGGDRAATVTWTGPSDGGSAITGYVVTATPGGRQCTTDGATRCVVDGLTNGTAYRFTVFAVNAVGRSPESVASSAVTPKAVDSVPQPPRDVVTTAGVGRLQVSWAEPERDGGRPITGYRATASPGGASCTTTGELTCSITGLSAGIAYTVSVTATNAVGTSSPSLSSDAAQPLGVPLPPTAVIAAASDGEAAVSWSRPEFDGGRPITGYRVTSQPGGRTCSTSGALTCTVTGLTNGTSYFFRVTATSDVGTSEASAPSDSVTPSAQATGRPGVPLDIVTVAGVGELTVFWRPPAEGAVSRYIASTASGSRRCTTERTSCTISDLPAGPYSVSVVAEGPGGTSDPGTAFGVADVLGQVTSPARPTQVVATPGRGEALVSWSVPPSSLGSEPTYFIVTAQPGGLMCGATAPSTECTVVGLTGNSSYTFTVVSRNNLTDSEPSEPSTSVRILRQDAVAGAPSRVQAVAGSDGNAVVTWLLEDDGDSPITQYVVTSNPDAQTCGTTDSLTCEVRNLRFGVDYTFTVVARNANGVSLPSQASNVIGAVGNQGRPNRPRSVASTSMPGAMAVTWAAPDYAGAHPIDEYVVTSLPAGGTCTVRGTDHGCSVKGLLGGVTYTFVVIARNLAGESAASAPSDPIMYAGTGIPSAPRITRVDYRRAGRSQAVARIAWDRPWDDGGSPISRFQYRIRSGTAAWSPWRPVATSPFEVKGLRLKKTYSLEFVAIGAGGTGEAATTTLRPQ